MADSAAIVQGLWNYCNVLRDEIIEDLRAALAQVQEIADDLPTDEAPV